jgi:hypothetical protein
MRPHTIIDSISWRIEARHNCQRANPVNTEWLARHTAEIDDLVREYLPSGSGLDNATMIDLDTSTANRIVLLADYHHMNDAGMYSGWTSHCIIVQPAFVHDVTVTVTGPNRNGVKDHIHELYAHALTRVSPHRFQPTYITPAQCIELE